MKCVIITMFSVLFFGILALWIRHYIPEWRGRRVCRQWLCPKCQVPFGASAEIKRWKLRKDFRGFSEMFSGPVLHCSRCHQKHWFNWTGRFLDSGLMMQSQSLEIVEM